MCPVTKSPRMTVSLEGVCLCDGLMQRENKGQVTRIYCNACKLTWVKVILDQMTPDQMPPEEAS